MKKGYSPTTQSDTLTIRLNPDQKKKLEQRAILYKSSVSAIIREAITVWLNLNPDTKG